MYCASRRLHSSGAYDVPEFVAKDSRLLPFGEIFVNGDCPAPQRPLPEAVDRWRESDEIDDAV